MQSPKIISCTELSTPLDIKDIIMECERDMSSFLGIMLRFSRPFCSVLFLRSFGAVLGFYSFIEIDPKERRGRARGRTHYGVKENAEMRARRGVWYVKILLQQRCTSE